jgi:hypothetical protein
MRAYAEFITTEVYGLQQAPRGATVMTRFRSKARGPSQSKLRRYANRLPSEPDQYISTSFVERQNLSLRMSQRRFTRLTNGFSKKLDNHVAAVALYVAHYNLCRVHEALKTTPAKALGVADRAWTTGDLIDAALATQPITPVTTAPERRNKFTVIEGGKR